MKVPFLDLKAEYSELRGEILEAVDRVGCSSAFILGQEVEAFENEFAAYCGAKHCVALNSGTSALHLGLLALGVQPGDEVITTPNTFFATVEAILYCGARPVFIDIDPSTANLDPRRIESAITPRTRAILPVHLYGRPADMDPIREIASRRGLRILEDAAQAHGAVYRGRRVGSLGNPAIFSFYPTKNLGANGEGGALVTDEEGIARYARLARAHGVTSRYRHEMIGYNYRMEGLQGAILRIKLRRLEEWTRKRREIASRYREVLESSPSLQFPADDPRDESVYHQFAIYVSMRDCVAKELAGRGIESAVHYPTPLHLQPACSSLGYPPGSFPGAEAACERVLSLPLHPWLSREQVEYVAQTTRELLSRK
ncbi:MAG TPA: DegT/DnrJ/EryC1/StrS family aminotransferase [Verrucomicrobiae bacterium]|nr:DegT/DnrJ/EryC1/StrS family aminotransferase [Verrucomicrobiae bacterium]